MISVRNPVAGPVNIVNGLIATSKKNKSAHGYGLMSIQKLLDKYDAFYSMACDGRHFQYPSCTVYKKLCGGNHIIADCAAWCRCSYSIQLKINLNMCVVCVKQQCLPEHFCFTDHL